MWNWFSINNAIAIIFLIAFLATLGYVVVLRFKMWTSKARFAFVVIATLASCLLALLGFLSGPGPVWMAGLILSGVRFVTGYGAFPDLPVDTVGWPIGLVATIAAFAAFLCIYRFAVRALSVWEGPVTLQHEVDS